MTSNIPSDLKSRILNALDEYAGYMLDECERGIYDVEVEEELRADIAECTELMEAVSALPETEIVGE